MSGAVLLQHATSLSLALLSLALLLTVIRIWRGPTLADRILALDTMTTVGMGMICAFALRTGYALYVDIAIALGLVGFLATVAFARYVMRRGAAEAAANPPREGDGNVS